MKSAGFSIIELLVVLALFSILSIIATQTVFLALRGARKSDAQSRVRTNIDYAISIIERHLHSAKKLNSACSGTSVDYTDSDEKLGMFACQSLPNGYVTRTLDGNTYRITSSDVKIIACSFTCTVGNPSQVNVSLSAEDASATGSDNVRINTSRVINLRSY